MLRALLMFLMLSLSSLTLAADQQKPLVLKSYDDAYKAMQKHKVPGIFVFHAKWCEPCKEMRKDVWNPLMPHLKKRYIVYFVDIEVETEIVAKWKKQNPKLLTIVPAYAIVAPGATTLVAYAQGYKDQKTWLKWMLDSILAWENKQPQPQPSPSGG